MMKKVLSLVSACALCFGVTFGAAACKKPKEEHISPFTISANAVSLDLYESKTLSAYYNGKETTAEWKSAAPEIVSVANGRLSAVATGETRVNAVYQGEGASCLVTVYDSGERPNLLAPKRSYTIGENGSVSFPLSVRYHAEEFESTLSIKSEGESAEVVLSNNTVYVTAKALGETVVTVSGTAKGYSLDPVEIRVHVVDRSSVVYTGSTVELFASDILGGKTREPVSVVVYDRENVLVQNAELVWSSSDEAIAKYNAQNGCIEAMGKAGDATIRATYRGIYTEIPVTVSKATVDLGITDIVFGGQAHNKTFAFSSLSGRFDSTVQSLGLSAEDIVAIYDVTNNRAVSFTRKGAEFTVENAADSGESVWLAQTNSVAFRMSVASATFTISEKADFEELARMYQENTVGNVSDHPETDNPTANWYIAVLRDLDLGGEYISGLTDAANNLGFGSNISSDGHIATFHGTFDGRGHTIKNFEVLHGFLCNLSSRGVIKNLALTGIIKNRDNDHIRGGGLLGNYGAGTVENCFIEGEIFADAGGMAGLYNYGQGTFRNSVFKITFADGNHGIFHDLSGQAASVSDCFVITEGSIKIDNGGTLLDDVVYESESAWAQNVSVLPSGFSSCWSRAENSLSFGGNAVLKWN